MQAVNSDLSTSGLLAEARRQSRDTTASCTRAVCTERLGDTDTDIPLSNTATHPALPACWQTPMTVSTAGKWSHTTFPFSDVQKQKAFNFIFNLLIDWFSQPISQKFSQLQRQNNAKLPCSLKFSLIQQRNWREIISFDNSWFPFLGIAPNAWRISHSRNSLTLHSIQL